MLKVVKFPPVLSAISMRSPMWFKPGVSVAVITTEAPRALLVTTAVGEVMNRLWTTVV